MRPSMLYAAVLLALLTAPGIAQDRPPLETAYFALKRAILPDMTTIYPVGGLYVSQSEPKVLSLNACSGAYEFFLGGTVSDQQLDLATVAVDINFAKLGLSAVAPPELWRDELIAGEEAALTTIAQGGDVLEPLARMRAALIGRLDGTGNGRWDRVVEANACGDGEAEVAFDLPIGARAQYMHAGIYDICGRHAPQELPPWFCAWIDYAGGKVLLSGTYKLRIVGKPEVYHYVIDRPGMTIKVGNK